MTIEVSGRAAASGSAGATVAAPNATSPVAPRRRRSWRGRLALLAGAVAVALLGAEIVARVVLSVVFAADRATPAHDREVRFGDVVRPAAHPDLVYELIPNARYRFQGALVETNTLGFRGPMPATPKPDGRFRVLALGDSVLFGWGVPWQDTGVAQLDELLREAVPARAADAVGTGVPGYNTAMQAELLRQHGVAHQPDVVVVDFVANDLDLPNFLLAPQDFWRLDHCFLLDLARRARRAHTADAWLPFVPAPMADGRYASDPALVPARYRHLVGVDAYRRALQSIVALGEERGFRVLVASHFCLLAEAEAVCRELGVPVADCAARIHAWLAERGSPPYEGSALTLAADDPHPSVVLHRWWAEAVLAKLRELDWLPR